MDKKQKQEYESPDVMISDISTDSVIMGSWGNGAIGDDDENNLYDF